MLQIKRLHVLLVEDSRAMAAPIINYLEQGGHRVTHVSSGEAALDAYRAEIPDMVLMDVVMPGIGGIEATRRIKAIPSERWVPLVMITALNGTDELIAGLDAGADDYMFKPLHFDVLEARMRSLQRIVAIQSTLAGLINNVIEGIIRINSHGLIQTFSNAAGQIFGYESREVLGQNIKMLMPAPYQENHDGYLARYLSTGEQRIIGKSRQVVGLRKNGSTFPMYLGITEVMTPEGQSFIGLVRDASAEIEQHTRIEHMAWHDALTGLPNRASLWRHLESRLGRATPLAVLFLDLDGFKQINDQHGHAIGDLILRTVAERLKNALPQDDMLCRLGGDEFVAVLDNIDSPAMALNIANRLIGELSPPIVLGEVHYAIGVSIGIAQPPPHGNDVQTLIETADAAMYQAKQGGRNRAVVAG